MPVQLCPSREELMEYVVGRLSDVASESLADHLDACQRCQSELATLPEAEDTLIRRLRQPAASEPYLEEPACQAALRRARAAGGVAAEPDEGSESGSAGLVTLPSDLGEYRLLEELGRGSMGAVYKARHTKLDRVVAVKILARGHMNDDRALARFEREIKAIGRLEHPNIVHAHDAREIGGRPVLIMEYVDGLDLGKLVYRLGPLPIAAACELARQAALGLQCAHEHGLVHRDVKPSNLVLSAQGQVKLLDLGLARIRRESGPAEEMTGTGQAMGTADYMAPEQVSDSRDVDIRADVYSLGCTLYKLLGGRSPFSGPEHRTAFQKMTAHVQQPVPPVRHLRPEIPEELAAVVGRMLAKDPAARYATPSEVAEALAPFCGCAGADLPSLLSQAARAPARDAASAGSGSRPPSDVGPRAAVAERRPPNRFRLALLSASLLLFGVAIGLAAGIVLRIQRGGQETTVQVPDGANVSIGDDGHVAVQLPGSAKSAPSAQPSAKPAANAGALPVEKAIQGTWQVVSSTMHLFPLDTGSVSAHKADEVTKSTKVVITDDTLKLLGEHLFFSMGYRYRVNATTAPPWIDLDGGQYGGTRLGIFSLEGERLTLCLGAPFSPTVPGTERPAAFWAEFGTEKELLVLRRIGDATVDPDEKAIRGAWRVQSNSIHVPDGLGLQSWTRGAIWNLAAMLGKERILRVTEESMEILPDPFLDAPAGMGGMGVWQKAIPFVTNYTINPLHRPKAIDLMHSPMGGGIAKGIFRLEGDELTLCLGETRPASFDAPKNEDPFAEDLFRAQPARPPSFYGPKDENNARIVLKRTTVPRPHEDQALILGTWRAVRGGGNERLFSNIGFGREGREIGEPIPAEAVGKWLREQKIVISKGCLIQWAYTLDPTKKPKTVDLLHEGKIVAIGTYELQPQRLKIRLTTRPQRPSSLDGKLDDEEYLLELERFRPPERPTLPVEVDRRGAVRVAGMEITAERLQGLLACNRAWKVELRCDADVPFSEVVKMHQAIEKAGIRSVSLAAPPTTLGRLEFRIAALRARGGKPGLTEKEVSAYIDLLKRQVPLPSSEPSQPAPAASEAALERILELLPGVGVAKVRFEGPGGASSASPGKQRPLTARAEVANVGPRLLDPQQIDVIRRVLSAVVVGLELANVTVTDLLSSDRAPAAEVREPPKPAAAPAADSGWAWFECPKEPVPAPLPELVSVLHGDRRYVLLSTRPDQTMLASDTGSSKWSIRSATAPKAVEAGLPALLQIELVGAGARRLAALTEAHLGGHLAVLVNDQVLTLPKIREKIGAGAAPLLHWEIPLQTPRPASPRY